MYITTSGSGVIREADMSLCAQSCRRLGVGYIFAIFNEVEVPEESNCLTENLHEFCKISVFLLLSLTLSSLKNLSSCI